jgi:hypothetical protein
MTGASPSRAPRHARQRQPVKGVNLQQLDGRAYAGCVRVRAAPVVSHAPGHYLFEATLSPD